MTEQGQPDNLHDLFSKVKKPSFKVPKLNLKFSRWIKILIVVLGIIVLAYNMVFFYVKPNEFGIKARKMGLNRGVQPEPYTAGLHFLIPWLEKMHRLPRDVQVLELTSYPSTAAETARKERSAHIQTSDGFFVDVDVSILYHIKDPYLVFTEIGPGSLFEDNGIIPKAEPALKETLGS